jgi:hypothetical protein
MKKKRWNFCIWMILFIGSLLFVTPVSRTTQAQEEGGYWELISVDIQEAPADRFTSHKISRGNATFRNELNGESFQASMNWSEPGQRYAAGQSIDLTLSANIDEYNWTDDDPGYTNQGLNYMSAIIYARIDEPDIGFGGGTGGAISFTDSQGKSNAKVQTDYGKIAIGSQTLQATAMFPPGNSYVDKLSIYITCTVGMNRYNYQWVDTSSEALEAPLILPTEYSNPEPEFEPEAPSLPASGGAVGRIIVVVGIAIAGTLSTIAGELANKAAQAAASGEVEQPVEETVYVLNPSHKQFDLEVNKPVTLTVNAYRVTKEGHQLEKGANISLNLTPDLAECFNIQTTTSSGQLTANITLLKIPSVSAAILDVNGIFPNGKAKTEVQLKFKMDFTILPVNSPNITFNEKEKLWQPPELVACFREPVQNTPIKVGFYYGFMDPPLAFEPDILEVKEGYSSDDGLTYNFKLKMRDGIDLEEFFGEDLTDDDGRVKVNVVVKDEKGKEFTAKTTLQVHPQLKMISYAYDPEKGKGKNNRPKTPYPGLELEDMQFIADGKDFLPLLIFFVRTDKEVVVGEEYLCAVDLVDVLSVKHTGEFPEPEPITEESGEGLFAYKIRSNDLMPYTKDKKKNHFISVEPVLRAGVPKNYGLAGMSPYLVQIYPQFLDFHFWVVPGRLCGTSEAYAYVQLNPLKIGVPNLPLSLEIENPPNKDRGFLDLINGDRNQTTREKDLFTSNEYIPLAQGSACWGLRYSGIHWDNLNSSTFGGSSPSEFRVICNGPLSDTGTPIWQTSQTINVERNISTLLSELLIDADSLKLNNPYWKGLIGTFPYTIRGAITNIFSNIYSELEPYVCKQMSLRIINWLLNRSLYHKGDDPKKIQSMVKMNGIEYEQYEIPWWHVWAGIFPSGLTIKNAKALDPWWEQRWDYDSLRNHENLITVYTELNTKLSERGLSVATISTIAAGVLAIAYFIAPFLAAVAGALGTKLAIPVIVRYIQAWFAASGGFQWYSNLMEGVDKTSAINNEDGTKKNYQTNWFMSFIESLRNSNN